MGKKITVLLLALLTAITLSGCSSASQPTDEGQSKKESGKVQQTGQTETEAIELTDQAGRKVVLEKPAERIVSCYYITTYAALALGFDDALVGIESKADSRAIYQMAASKLLELPSVGTLKEFDIEAAIALKPDLVIMPKKLITHVDALTEVGISVLVVYPESQELLEEMLVLIGKATRRENEANRLLQYYQERMAALQTVLADAKEVPNVYMAGNGSYLSVAARDMYQSHMVELAKGKNAASDVEGDYWTEVSYEDILVMNPDVIVVPSKAEYTVEDILNDAQLSTVNAVKNGAVYQMPTKIEEWDSPIPSGILGIEWLASILHEELYPFDTMKENVVEFYQSFYGFALEPELITK